MKLEEDIRRNEGWIENNKEILTNFENHRTQSEYELSLSFRTM